MSQSSSQSLTLYRSTSPSSSLSFLSSSSYNLSLSTPARLFTQQTGTAIATELLYRILIEILNRVFASFQRFASDRLDSFTEFLEQRARDKLLQGQKPLDQDDGTGEGEGALGIVEEVSKMVEQRGGFGSFPVCPISGGKGERMDHEFEYGGRRGGFGARRRIREGRTGPPRPPRWVRGVLEGIEEGRLEGRDFWVQTHGD